MEFREPHRAARAESLGGKAIARNRLRYGRIESGRRGISTHERRACIGAAQATGGVARGRVRAGLVVRRVAIQLRYLMHEVVDGAPRPGFCYVWRLFPAFGYPRALLRKLITHKAYPKRSQFGNR